MSQWGCRARDAVYLEPGSPRFGSHQEHPAPEGVSGSELEPALRLALELDLEARLELDEAPDCDDEDEFTA